MASATPTYQPRATERGVLHCVVREHLETFLAEAARAAGGGHLPEFVEHEFRDFLTCGVLAHGFARVRCDTCAFERLLPFSCKGRGFCPSCGGRRMTERAAHLVTEVLPRVPVRQWVLSLPYRLRYVLTWDHELCRAVLGVFARTLLDFYCRRGTADGRTGTLTVIQRFGGGLNLNVHFHTLVLDGVFTEPVPGEPLVFHAAPPPSDAEVGRVVVTVRKRVLRLLERRGYGPDAEAAQDPLVEESPVLAGITSASVLGQVAVGRRAGARVWRLGSEPDAPWVASTGPRQAHLDGVDLHADLRVAGHDRKRLEHLCRYLLRPPLAQERLRLLADGRVLVQLKRVWADGTSHLLFEPLEFLEKLAALTPRPRINLLLYHGVLGPHARWRSRIVPGPEAPTLEMGARLDDTRGASGNDTTGRPQPPRHWRWADLLRRAFAHPINCNSRRGGDRAGPGHASLPSAVRAGARRRDAPAQLG